MDNPLRNRCCNVCDYSFKQITYGDGATGFISGQEIQDGQSLLKNRLGVKENLSERDRVIFYSSWIYPAIHALVSIPGYQTPEKIGQRLKIGTKQVVSAVEFLLEMGLVERSKQGNLIIGKRQTHLGADSPLIVKYHTSWRVQAIRAIEEDPQQGLHYSSVVSASRRDLEILKEGFIEAIKNAKEVIRKSPEEELCAISLDFYKV